MSLCLNCGKEMAVYGMTRIECPYCDWRVSYGLMEGWKDTVWYTKVEERETGFHLVPQGCLLVVQSDQEI